VPWARRVLHALAIVFLAILFLGADSSGARYDKLGNSMMCMCGCRQILLQCSHVGCQVSDGMTKELRVALSRGDSEDLVIQAFVQKYGETVLAAPPASGFNLVAWVTPFAVFLTSLLLATMVVRRWRMRPAVVSHETSSLSPGELEGFRARARRETEL